ncbi:MAG TPA: type II secretion system protein GspJ, partial [bacterium]|nr:type II secretion system protein GspJ [bacterium]
FLRPAADLETAPGIVKVEYLLSEEPEPKLLRRLTVNLLSPEEPEPIEELLCQPVSSFTLRYFDGSQWLETWDSTTRGDCLPVAVEITIERPVTQDSAENKEHRIFRRVVNLPCWSAPSDISVAESQFS